MATSWVVDASIAAKLIVDESDSAKVREFVEEAFVSGRLLAPTLLRYEVGQLLTRGGVQGVDAMLQKALAIIGFVDPAEVASLTGPLTYYDAAYLALAIEHGAGLMTADEKMRKAAKGKGIVVWP